MGTSYWKSKVLPKIKKVFETNSRALKKAAAADSTKIFDDSKEEYNKEFEEKKGDLQPQVVKIYEASSVELKALIKEPKDAGLKKYSAEVQKILDDLVKIEFPGSKPVSEACSKFGASYVSGPVSFVFEKVSTFIPVEATTEETTATAGEIKDKEIVIETEEKKEEEKKEVETPAPEKSETPPAEPAVTTPAASTEPPKVVEAPVAPAPAPAPVAPAPAAAPTSVAPAPAATPAPAPAAAPAPAPAPAAAPAPAPAPAPVVPAKP